MEIALLPIMVTFLASVLGTISGFGISTLMIPALVTVYALPQLLLFVGIIHLSNDIWKLFFFHRGIRWRILFYFGAAGFFTAAFGAWLAIHVGTAPYFLQILGAFLVSYSFFLLVKPTFALKETTLSYVQGGALSGFFAGLFGMGGLMRGLVLISFNMDKAIYLATASAAALVVDVTRIAVYRLSGVVLSADLFISLMMCIPISFVGAKIGEHIVLRISQQQFRYIVAILIFLMGFKLLIKL